jgi:two-component system response regulator NreC
MSREQAPESRAHEPDKVLELLLVDDHAVVRAGLRLLVERERDLRVAGEAASVEEAAELGQTPDVILLDLVLGHRLWGPDTVRAAIAAFPDARVLALSMIDSLAVVDAVLAAGAHGYILKDAAADEVVNAIRAVASGMEYVQPALGAAMIRWKNPLVTSPGHDAEKLTPREREVFRLVALGYTNAEIAQTLALALRTVEAHRSHIVHKTGAHTRAQLVRLAQEARLIE